MCRSETGDDGKPVVRCYKGLKSGTVSTLMELERQLNVAVSDVRPSPSYINIADDSTVCSSLL